MKNKASLVAFLVLGLVSVLGCGQLQEKFIESLPKETESSPKGFSLAGKEWKTFELDGMEIKVDLPGDPSDKTPSASQMPLGASEVFSAIKIHAYDEKDFGSSYSQLNPTGKQKLQLKELADTSMAAIKKQAPDLKYRLEMKSAATARYIGSFSRSGKSFELRGCCVYQKSKPERVWSVITVFEKDNADGQTASKRIIESVTFKDSSETCQ